MPARCAGERPQRRRPDQSEADCCSGRWRRESRCNETPAFRRTAARRGRRPRRREPVAYQQKVAANLADTAITDALQQRRNVSASRSLSPYPQQQQIAMQYVAGHPCRRRPVAATAPCRPEAVQRYGRGQQLHGRCRLHRARRSMRGKPLRRYRHRSATTGSASAGSPASGHQPAHLGRACALTDDNSSSASTEATSCKRGRARKE